MIGQTISHYKILGKLGEGGMGIVYKALDTQLDRTVALKFMPEYVASDETEVARFLQEAKAASALNHPNVCTIYGIHDEGGHRFIEMEFVDGVTLRQKLPIHSMSEALAYGVQIGDALHEAHQRGIVHRDIKADNLMVKTKNQVKVMDFGLAKLKGSLKLTKATSTVGTLAYMAPEQLEGGEVDARSDIFSYGVVLYEMLTGRLPFRSEHEAALMYSILNDDPEPIQKFRSDLSPVLTNMIQRALEKNPNERFQSINEMVIELRRLQKQSTKVSRTSLPSMPSQSAPVEYVAPFPPPASAPEAGWGRRKLWIGAAAAAAIIAAAALWLFVLGPPSRFALNPNMTFRPLQAQFREIGYPSISRDGGWAAFPAAGDQKTYDVYLMNSSSGEPRKITDDSAGFMASVDFSPDGGQIVYDRSDKGFTKPEVATVSSLGGVSKRIVSSGFFPRWRPDGQRIAYFRSPQWGSGLGKSEIRSVKPNGTDDRLEFTDSLNATGMYAWSPDGRSICWCRRVPAGYFELYVHDLETGKERQLTSFKKQTDYVCWIQNDQVIFSSNVTGNFNLWMIPASGGTPVQITRGGGPDLAPAVSADLKRLIYLQQQGTAHLWLAPLQQAGAQQITFDEAQLNDPCFSPDGQRILYVNYGLDPSQNIATIEVIRRDGKDRRQLISEEGSIHSPLWSPDGKWIVYAAHRDTISHDSAKAYILDAENPGAPRQIGIGLPAQWIDDRSFVTNNSGGSWTCTIDGAPPKRFFRDSTAAQPVLGGRYVVYMDVVQGRKTGVWLEAVPGSQASTVSPRQLIKSVGSYAYDAASKSVYYASPQNDLRRLSLPDGGEQVVPGNLPGFSVQSSFAISLDGRFIAYLDPRRASKLMLIDNLH